MPAHSSVIAALAAAVEVSPEDLPLRLHLASLLLEAGEHPAARELFPHVLPGAPAPLGARGGGARAGGGGGDTGRAAGSRGLLRALGGPPPAPPEPPAPPRELLED